MQRDEETVEAKIEEMRVSLLKQIGAQFGKPSGDSAYCAYCGTETQSKACHVCKSTEYLVPRESPVQQVDQFFEAKFAPIREMRNSIIEH
jgi:hypothetical protein